jgi:hypothetical protein
MIQPNSLAPDFSFYETVANNGQFHMLSIGNHTDTTFAHFDAYKWPNDEPYYSMSWETRLTAKQAAVMLENTDSIVDLGAKKGVLTVLDEEQDEDYEYDWQASEVALPAGASVHDIEEVVGDTTSLIRLDTEETAIVWAKTYPETTRAHMGLITAHAVDVRWISLFYGATVNPNTRPTVDRSIGRIASALHEFMNTPFGEPILQGGFTKDQ